MLISCEDYTHRLVKSCATYDSMKAMLPQMWNGEGSTITMEGESTLINKGEVSGS